MQPPGPGSKPPSTLRYLTLAVFVLLVLVASLLAGSFEAGGWYHEKLHKPSWAPPSSVLGVLRSAAYLTLALAGWNMWQTGSRARRAALGWWLSLLALEVLWAGLFFGLHRIGWSWLLLCLTVAVTAQCIRVFHPISPRAALLMLPYLLWIVFSWALNLAEWTINGGLLGRFLD